MHFIHMNSTFKQLPACNHLVVLYYMDYWIFGHLCLVGIFVFYNDNVLYIIALGT